MSKKDMLGERVAGQVARKKRVVSSFVLLGVFVVSFFKFIDFISFSLLKIMLASFKFVIYVGVAVSNFVKGILMVSTRKVGFLKFGWPTDKELYVGLSFFLKIIFGKVTFVKKAIYIFFKKSFYSGRFLYKRIVSRALDVHSYEYEMRQRDLFEEPGYVETFGDERKEVWGEYYWVGFVQKKIKILKNIFLDKGNILLMVFLWGFVLYVIPYLGILDKYDIYIYSFAFVFLLISMFYYSIIFLSDVNYYNNEEREKRAEGQHGNF